MLDKNSNKRIYNILLLKGHCLDRHNDLINRSNGERGQKSTFFSTMSDVVDVPLWAFLNEEVSAALEERGPMRNLLNKIINDHQDEGDRLTNSLAINDIPDLFRNRIDFLIGSSLLDFTVASFSVFEFWLSKIYDVTANKVERAKRKEESLRSLLEKYNISDSEKKPEILQQIMGECGSFISSSEKINHVLSQVKRSTRPYRRNLKVDRTTVDFYRSSRNTVHNLGVNMHSSLRLDIDENQQIDLRQGFPSYTNDHNSRITLCRELVAIYEAIIDCLELEQSSCCFQEARAQQG